MTEINIYCDESSHLEHDGIGSMVLGAVYCPKDICRVLSTELRNIKEYHGLSRSFETKWTKVSKSKQDYYLDVLDYFFTVPELRFRGLLVPDKSKLRHEAFDQDHSKWYFKMFFYLLKVIVNPQEQFNIFLDIKDTRSQERVEKLGEVLSNDMLDFQRAGILNIQTVRSHEVEIMQITDLIIGAIGYANRDLSSNLGKVRLVEELQGRAGTDLIHSTPLGAKKFNLFRWQCLELE